MDGTTRNNRRRTGFILAMISAVAWGSYGIFFMLLTEKGLSEATIITLAAVINTVYFLSIGILAKTHKFSILTFKHGLLLFVSGVLSNGMGYSYAQAYANNMPVGIVSLIAFCNVIVLVILSYLFFNFRITIPVVGSIVSALIGVALVLNILGTGKLQMSLIGIIWALTIPLILGVIYAINHKLLLDGVDGNTIMFLRHLCASVLMLIFQIGHFSIVSDLSKAFHQGGSVGWIFLGFAVIPTVLCYVTWQEAYKRIEPAYVQIIYSLDPTTAFMLGFLFFGQGILWSQLIGMILILIAIANLVLAEGRAKKKPARG